MRIERQCNRKKKKKTRKIMQEKGRYLNNSRQFFFSFLFWDSIDNGSLALHMPMKFHLDYGYFLFRNFYFSHLIWFLFHLFSHMTEHWHWHTNIFWFFFFLEGRTSAPEQFKSFESLHLILIKSKFIIFDNIITQKKTLNNSIIFI